MNLINEEVEITRQLINEEEEITRWSQPYRQLSTLRISTMHYILHEISYMSKTVVGYARYKKIPIHIRN